MYRQGDVLLIPTALPDGPGLREVPRDRGRIVLAYGEATGHAHAITDSAAGLLEQDGKRFLTATEPVRLLHEEHDPIALPAGTYEVRRQMEYEPRRIRYVND